MLIINILLIILFFIILFYDINLIEGQGVTNNDPNVKNDESDKKMYNYNNLLTDFYTFINKINLSNYLGFDLKNVMEKYNSQCVDTDEPISAEFKKQKIYEIVEDENIINTEINILNTENIINRFLSPFKIEIKGDHDTFNTNEILDNADESKLCSLVDTIYNNNNNVSGSLVKSITDEYGNCFTHKEGGTNKFSKLCEQSCHIQEDKLETCVPLSFTGVTNCSEHINNVDNYLQPIHIKKNGLYYNCSLTYKQGAELTYIENPCVPKFNMCKKLSIGFKKSCEDYNIVDHIGTCEDYYMFDDGTYYNCISDDNDFHEGLGMHVCKKDVNNHNQPCYNETLINYNKCNQIYNN